MLNSITNSKIEGDEEELIKKSYKNIIRYSSSRFENSQFNTYLDNEGNYTQYMIQGSILALNHKYKEALLQFKNSYIISQQIDDEYKKKESLCHIGIIQLLLGNFESNSLLEKLFDNYIDDMKNQTFDIGSINLILFSKIGSNLILALFIKNELNTSMKVMNSMIDIINQQKENLNKLYILKNIIFILFRCKSLTGQKYKYLDNKILNQVNEMNSLDDDDDTIMKYSIHQLFEELNNYLKTNNLEQFFESIVKLRDSLNKLNDYNGLIFIIYSEIEMMYINQLKIKNLNNNSITFDGSSDINIKISALFQAINNPIKNKIEISHNLENIELLFNQKLETASKIYNLLCENEIYIYELIKQENVIKESINYDLVKKNKKLEQGTFKQFLINIIKQIICEIENIENNITKIQVISQLQHTITILENNKNIYFSENIMEPCLKIIKKTIEKKLNYIIKNIYLKFKKAKYFKIFQINSNRKLIEFNNEKLKNFYNYQYQNVIEGNIIAKLNLGNNGIKEHFYIVNNNNEQIDCYKNKSSGKPYKILKFNQIIKVTFGLKTQNLINKIKNVPHSYEAWKFLSLNTNKYSLDLIFNSEVTTKKWFYGIQYILKNTNRQYKINSTSGFIILKLKMKLASKLGKNTRDSHTFPFVKTMLNYYKKKNI